MVSDSSSDDSEAHSSHEYEEEEKEASSPLAGGEKKRKVAPTGEAGGSKKGRTLLQDYNSDAEDGGEEWPSRVKPLDGHSGSSPWQNRKYPDTRITYGAPPLFGIF